MDCSFLWGFNFFKYLWKFHSSQKCFHQAFQNMFEAIVNDYFKITSKLTVLQVLLELNTYQTLHLKFFEIFLSQLNVFSCVYIVPINIYIFHVLYQYIHRSGVVCGVLEFRCLLENIYFVITLFHPENLLSTDNLLMILHTDEVSLRI